MCYVNTTVNDVMVGWVGDHPTDLTGHIFCDADFAGDVFTLKSTSGCHVDIQGPNSRMPISCNSGGQSATAQSSTEAETAALGTALQSRGEGMLSMLERILGKYHRRERMATGGFAPRVQHLRLRLTLTSSK